MILKKHLYLVGFMGAGKTTVGKILAQLIGCEFLDLDQEIVERESRSVNDIFRNDGEDRFRDIESAVLHDTVGMSPRVIATGGGVVEREGNRQLMQNAGHTVFLATPWETVMERLAANNDRPLAPQGGDQEIVRKRYLKRLPCYESADFVVLTSGRKPESIAREIIEMAGLTR